MASAAFPTANIFFTGSKLTEPSFDEEIKGFCTLALLSTFGPEHVSSVDGKSRMAIRLVSLIGANALFLSKLAGGIKGSPR